MRELLEQLRRLESQLAAIRPAWCPFVPDDGPTEDDPRLDWAPRPNRNNAPTVVAIRRAALK